MSLTFYYGSGSPYAWRVWLALEHKGIAYQLNTLSFSAGDLRQPEFRALNPRGRVPTIEDDGFALYESVAIVEYLDEHYPGPRLFPGDVRMRARVRRMVQEADQYFDRSMDQLVEEILFKPKEEWNADAIVTGRAAVARELEVWEATIAGEWLACDVLSAADFALYPMVALVQRMEKRKPDLDARGVLGPKMAGWVERFEALPICRKTWPPHWK